MNVLKIQMNDGLIVLLLVWWKEIDYLDLEMVVVFVFDQFVVMLNQCKELCFELSLLFECIDVEFVCEVLCLFCVYL